MNTLLIYVLALSVFLGLVCIYGCKIVDNQRGKIASLKKEINDLKKQPAVQKNNLRGDFRIEISQLPCEVTFLRIENEKMKKLENNKIATTIENISSTGLKLDSEYNLPVKYKIKIRVEFELKDDLFSFNGYIVRKEEHVKSKMISYGIQFFEATTKEQQKLIVKLHQIEAERRQRKIS
ncbi:PilZ domain-containing protein [Virgibacillus litoralis]|uniref:C-di-GMP-binding flagellar brake protein YcgR n=1 Tax=Virgibacillus litoralis TaxID=578221 RepID=A0ABS4HC30_9BACI|nr:PilZ domain-containing protein [Virgibacillus litoralis]MBP1948472.1 c-di-GMP-binding flagellar brake protein YcgR [Virgibacillus litoralis]